MYVRVCACVCVYVCGSHTYSQLSAYDYERMLAPMKPPILLTALCCILAHSHPSSCLHMYPPPPHRKHASAFLFQDVHAYVNVRACEHIYVHTCVCAWLSVRVSVSMTPNPSLSMRVCMERAHERVSVYMHAC